MTATLAESDETQVVYYSGKSKFVLVTFSPMRKLGKTQEFWGDTYSKKNAVSTLSFVAKRPHWYPTEDTNALIERVLPALTGQRRICYGYSMGGFAALKYSSRLDAVATLAFSPQFSIDPNEIRDPRFLPNFSESNRGMAIAGADLCDRNFIVCDRYFRLDWLNMKLIRRTKPESVHFLSVPFAGHSTINLATGSQNLTALLTAVMHRPTQARREALAVLRARRRQSPAYYEQLAKRVARSGRAELSRRILDAGAARTASPVAAALARAKELAQTDVHSAVEYLERLADTDNSPRLRAHLARYLHELDMPFASGSLRREVEVRTGKVVSLEDPRRREAESD